jgi:hypothetical protein
MILKVVARYWLPVASYKDGYPIKAKDEIGFWIKY